MIYLQLFWEYFKVGLFSIGGGMATIPFLYDMSDKTGWFTHAELANMIAVSESTPGPVGVNMATYVGYLIKGIPGSLIATFGLVLPSVVIILLVAKILQKFRSSKLVEAAFYGLRPASTGLIAAAGVSVGILALFQKELYAQTGNFLQAVQYKGVLLAIVVFVLMQFVKPTKKLHPIIFILFSAVIGVVFRFAE